MKKWKEELEALETEWQLVPSMCMLLNYAARYTDRPEDCKLGVKTAIDVLNETTLTSKYAESSFYSQDVISLLFNTTMHKTLTSCLGGGALLHWVSKHKHSFSYSIHTCFLTCLTYDLPR